MKNDPSYYLYTCANTRRWHTKPDFEQNVAQHSFGVALIIATQHPNPSPELLKAALFHDLHEKKSGDMPYEVKNLSPNIRQMEELLQQNFWDELPIKFPKLKKEELLWLEYADMLEVMFFLSSGKNILSPESAIILEQASAIVLQKVTELTKFGYFETSQNHTVH